MTRVFVPAKLNLTLDITGREGEYHLLDSLAVTIDVFDRVAVRKKKRGLKVVMHGMESEDLPEEQNNARRAAVKFAEKYEIGGAEIVIHKNIPMRAGLGGSSADAAGVLLALAEEYKIEDMGGIKSLADSLGSDTGYLLSGGLCRLRGRGEIIEELPGLPALYFLVVCPERGVGTAECFARYDGMNTEFPPRTGRAAEALSRGSAEEAARYFSNALTEAAVSVEPSVGGTLSALRSLSPLGAAMTGSGSACFAAFPCRELAEWAKSRYRGEGRTFVARPAKRK